MPTSERNNEAPITPWLAKTIVGFRAFFNNDQALRARRHLADEAERRGKWFKSDTTHLKNGPICGRWFCIRGGHTTS